MCSVYGWTGEVPIKVKAAILNGADARGRDGWGVVYNSGESHCRSLSVPITEHEEFRTFLTAVNLIGNHRATPTTEHESKVSMLQPYDGIVHNGVIANDTELNGGVKLPIDSMVLPKIFHPNDIDGLSEMVDLTKQIKGSFAIGFEYGFGSIMLARNYKPLYYRKFEHGFAFASQPEMLLEHAIEMKPYSCLQYLRPLDTVYMMDIPRETNRHVVVSASSGLDSTVVAYMLKAQEYNVHLVHFLYDCLAETNEVKRIKEIAQHGEFDLHFIQIPKVFKGSIVEGRFHQQGVEGTEYAHDWVSGRNLLMLSLLTSFAETNGWSHIAFGGNLEEAGSYPDNESEFGRKFNQLLPYATQNGVKIELLQPVGDLMKHEIVKAGLYANTPLDLTWSCYGDGEYHCGHCGPCFMRKTAFERNGLKDPVTYLS